MVGRDGRCSDRGVRADGGAVSEHPAESTFNGRGVAIYKHAQDAETLLPSDTGATASSDEQADEEVEAALSTVDAEFGRTTAPVRMYMREMGSSELLTRPGEIEVAKRIKAGLQDMIQAIAACPSVVSMFLADADRVGSGESRIDELVDGIREATQLIACLRASKNRLQMCVRSNALSRRSWSSVAACHARH